jgi:hypothetical protein
MELLPQSQHETLFQLVAGPLLHEVQTAFGHERQAEYLLASNLRRQVWHFWLHACVAEPAQDVAQHLIYTKSKILIAEALDSMGINKPCPGILHALGKLGQFALTKETYQNLLEILVEGGRGAKSIMHQGVLTAEMIDRLHLLPDPLRREKIAFGEDVNIAHLERISFILKRRPSLISCIDHADIGDARRILSNLFDEVRKYPHSGRFPIVWKGNNRVRPVGSSNELERLAAEMNNCLISYWDDLQTGQKSLFVLVGRAPLAISFARLPGLGWELEQVRGSENRLPTRHEYQRIRQGFSSRPEFFIPKENLVRTLLSQAHYAIDDMPHGDQQ